MLLIAHRGLIDGPNKELENNPRIVNDVMSAGYDAEIDLQVVNNELYLGHDEPTYKVSLDFLIQRGLWIHAKNVEALRFLTSTIPNVNYFYHEEDPMIVTTHGWIWVHPKHLENNLSKIRTIAVVPEYVMSIDEIKNLNVTGICSDYVKQLK
jgi:Mn-containing catalase